MTDLNELQLSDFRDTLAIMNYEMEMKVMGRSGDESVPVGVQAGRDKCRTPMQWENTKNAGFCPDKVKPWLPVNGNFAQGTNVRDQQNDPESILSFYKRAICFRNQHDVLQYGDFHLVESPDDRVLIFERELFENRVLVTLNFSSESVNLDTWNEKKEEDFSTVCPPGKVQSEVVVLLPFEGRLYLSDKKATEVIKK